MSSNLSVIVGADTSKFVQEVKSAQHMLEKYVKSTEQASNEIHNNTSATTEQINAYKTVLKTLEKVASGTLSTKQQQAALTDSVKELKIQWANLTEQAKQGEFGKMMESMLTESQSALRNLSQQVKQADTEMQKFGTGNVRRQLSQTRNALVALTIQYRQLSEAEKQSAQGQELSRKMDQLRQKAGTLRDAVDDVNNEVKALASDTRNLDVFNDAVGIGADLLSSYSSIMARVTGDEQALKDALSTVMAAQYGVNALTKIGNALQSSSAIMLKIRKIQELSLAAGIKIRTLAEKKGMLATKAATVAQKAFNLVARANPYVILATAALAAGAAIYSFTKYLSKSREEQERASQSAEELKKKQEKLVEQQNEISSAAGEAGSKFAKLQVQWKNLISIAEKTQWIKDNKSNFEQLGFSIDSVSTAESIFEKNTDSVIRALLKRAASAKLAEQYAERLAAIYKKMNERSEDTGHQVYTVKEGDRLSGLKDYRIKAAGLKGGVDFSYGGSGETAYKLTKSGIDKINRYAQQAAEKRRKRVAEELKQQEQQTIQTYTDIQKEVNKLTDQISSFGDTTSSNNNKSTSKTHKQQVVKAAKVRTDAEKEKIELKGIVTDIEADTHSQAVKDFWKDSFDKPIKVPVIPDFKQKVEDNVKKRNDVGKQNFDNIKEGIDHLGNLNYAIGNTILSWDDLEKRMENMSPFERVVTVIDQVVGSIQAAINAYESITRMIEIFGEISKAAAAKKVAADAMEIASSKAKTTANSTEAGTEAVKQGSKLPFPANLAAIAAGIAAVVSAIAVATSFAEGGIFNGKSTVGDYNIARVNSGEMILNGTQQKRLFNLLNSNTTDMVNTIGKKNKVVFEIKGTKLTGTLKNFYNKTRKI